MKKGIIILIMCLVTVMLSACGGKNPKTDEELRRKEFLQTYTKDGKSRCIIRLSADRCSFYVGEDSIVELSVMIPFDRMEALGVTAEYFADGIEILHGEGVKSAEITPDKISVDEQGNVTGSIKFKVKTEESGYQKYYAKAGDYTSAKTMIIVTPHITEAQANEAVETGRDLCSFLEDNFTEEDEDETVAKAAAEYLERDERVEQVRIEGTSVYFNTTAGIANVFCASERDPELLSLGGKSENDGTPDFETDSATTALFEQYGDDAPVNSETGPVRLDSGNTITNGNVLILRPATNAMWDPAMPQLKHESKKINKITGSSIVDEKLDDDAVKSILDGDLVNYGTVILQTHGLPLEKTVDGVTSQCGVIFLLYEAKSFTNNPATEAEVSNKLRSYAQMEYESKNGEGSQAQVDDFYRNFYGKVGEEDSWRLFYYYGRDFGSYVYNVCMTNRYIMERYSDSFFDNTVFYLGACYGVSFYEFDEWCINRGCQLLIGYMKQTQVTLSLLDFGDFFDGLTAKNGNVSWRTYDVQEAGSLYDINPFFYPNFAENVLQFELRWFSKASSASEHVGLLGNNNLFYRGDGTLKGHVCYLYSSEDGKTTEKPCKDAEITPHFFMNRSFSQKSSVKTDADGAFSVEKMQCGVYALEVKDTLDRTEVTSIVFDQKELDGGKICLPGPSLFGQVVDKKTKQPIQGAEVTLNGLSDGTVEHLTTDENGFWEWTYATQKYDIYVSYQDLDGVYHENVIPGTDKKRLITELGEDYRVTGKAVDALTGEPLPETRVACVDQNGKEVSYTSSDKDGLFELDGLPEGESTLVFTHEEYADKSMTITMTSDHPLNELDPVELEPDLQDPAISLYRVRHYNGHTYAFYWVGGDCTWREAANFAHKSGGHLVTITSEEEEAEVADFLCSQADVYEFIGSFYVWIGAYRTDAKSPWKWVTGEDYSFSMERDRNERYWNDLDAAPEDLLFMEMEGTSKWFTNYNEAEPAVWYACTGGKDHTYRSSSHSLIAEWDYECDP